MGYTAANYRTHDPEFKKQTNALRKKGHGISPHENVIKKRKQILDYINKYKKLPPPRTPLGYAAANYRTRDPKFKKETNAALKKAGAVTSQDVAKRKRKQVLAYMKKHQKLPPRYTPLGHSAANYRFKDPEFKKETDKYRRIGHGIPLQERVIKKRKRIIAYMKKHQKLPPLHTPLGSAAASYRHRDPKFKEETDKYRRKRK